MSGKEIANSKERSVYKSFDEQDELQIINSEKYLTSGNWLYEAHGQYSISYDGIRAFASWLAKHGIIVQTVSSDVSVKGENLEKTFHAKVRVKEANTSVVFEGISSQSQYGTKKDDTRYFDSTAETKAHSKAERNAIRKHIPPDLIAKFIEETKNNGHIKTLEAETTAANTASGKPKKSDSGDNNKIPTEQCTTWCKCKDPKIRFEKDQLGKYTGHHTCVTCNLPVTDAEKIIKAGGPTYAH